MKELVVISGKGGTGKTSIVGALAALASGSAVLADCDVDAADLHLLFEPETVERHTFSHGHEAVIDPDRCTGCGACIRLCRFGAIMSEDMQGKPDPSSNEIGVGSSACRDCSYCVRSCPARMNADVAAMLSSSVGSSRRPALRVDPIACEGCGVCVWFCPADAIELRPTVCGEWMVSRTRHGWLVHACLGIAAENSGKLVTTVRQAARALAEREGKELILVDGSPGVGCPVIASISGADAALVVTEPTVSGRHDLARVAKLLRHFDIRGLLCVNKADLNPELAETIGAEAEQLGLAPVGCVEYLPEFTRAQQMGLSVVELDDAGPAGQQVRGVWQACREALTNG